MILFIVIHLLSCYSPNETKRVSCPSKAVFLAQCHFTPVHFDTLLSHSVKKINLAKEEDHLYSKEPVIRYSTPLVRRRTVVVILSSSIDSEKLLHSFVTQN